MAGVKKTTNVYFHIKIGEEPTKITLNLERRLLTMHWKVVYLYLLK